MVYIHISKNKKGFVNNTAYFEVLKYFYNNPKPFYSYEDIGEIIGPDCWKDNLKNLLKGKKVIKYRQQTLEQRQVITELSTQSIKELGIYSKPHYFIFNKDEATEMLTELFMYYVEDKVIPGVKETIKEIKSKRIIESFFIAKRYIDQHKDIGKLKMDNKKKIQETGKKLHKLLLDLYFKTKPSLYDNLLLDIIEQIDGLIKNDKIKTIIDEELEKKNIEPKKIRELSKIKTDMIDEISRMQTSITEQEIKDILELYADLIKRSIPKAFFKNQFSYEDLGKFSTINDLFENLAKKYRKNEPDEFLKKIAERVKKAGKQNEQTNANLQNPA